ncbi:hypothetical protein [Paenibacillus sp. sgz302251]|uniref:hypothetical protein n=1 Tax=Paenibacillus sp. sgz302251 TaxID=3414493 RepID=UPI003C7A9C99
MKKHYDQVYRFHAAAGIEMPDKPTKLDRGGRPAWPDKYGQKLAELSEEMKMWNPMNGGEALKRASYMVEEMGEFLTAETIEDQTDALIDLIYFAIGTFTLMGVNPEPLFNIVARANLGKIMPDGTVLRDEQGKIQKPDGWKEKFAPEQKIKDEIERQAQVSE